MPFSRAGRARRKLGSAIGTIAGEVLGRRDRGGKSILMDALVRTPE